MTEPRVIGKDKVLIKFYQVVYDKRHQLVALASHYIAQYEAAQDRISELESMVEGYVITHDRLWSDDKAAQARIAELERDLEKEKEITKGHVAVKIMQHKRLEELLAQEEEERPRIRMDNNSNLARMVGDE